MAQDDISADEFPLTHEFLAQMLGVRRASISEVMSELQEAGLIASRRGRVVISDRQRLKTAACECYRVIRQEYDRLLGGS
jgi:DNA-binding FadR family transcriptional regulator